MSYDTNLRAAVRDLIAANGRYHNGIEYARLVAAFNAGETTMAGKITSKYALTHDEQAKMMEQYARDMMPIKPDPIYDARATTTAVQHAIKPDPRYDARCALQDKTDWSSP
jgi:hypothetical protein